MAAFLVPTASNVAYPNKLDDCSRCHGPSLGTYYEEIMSISVSKTTLSPGEVYSVGIDIVIQSGLSKKDTGYAIEDLGSSTWVVWLDETAVQSHYDQAMTAPSAPGTYNYRVWGESGPATSDGKTDYDDYTIIVQAPPTNGPPALSPLSNVAGNAGAPISFSASATDPDGDTLRYTWSFGDGSALAVGNPMSHTYTLAGIYSFTVYVDDLHDHNVSGSASASVAFNLDLVLGYNLIGLPIPGYKASTIGLLPGEIAIGFSSVTQSYNRSYTMGSSPAFKDFSLIPGEGYWIYAMTARTLHLPGPAPSGTQTMTVTVPASGGWTLFSPTTLKTTYKASNLPSWYTGGAIQIVAAYDPSLIVYMTWTPGSPPFKDFPLIPGHGYWIWVDASGTISYAA